MPEFDPTVRYLPIDNFPGYKVGTDGTVWSCYWRGPRGKGRGKGSARVLDPTRWHQLTPCPRPNGYLAVCMHAHGKQHFLAVHILVVSTFIGPRPEGQWCRHLNGIKQDNRLENLAWDTPSKNQLDKRAHGTMPQGETHHNAKLTADQCEQIKTLHQQGLSVIKLAELFHAGRTTIYRITKGRHWPNS